MAKKNFNNVSDDLFSAGLTPKSEIKPKQEKQTKKDNYKIVVAIDDDITEYFNNIMWIKRDSKSGYINNLIRQDFIQTIGAKKNATDEEIADKWQEYKKQWKL